MYLKPLWWRGYSAALTMMVMCVLINTMVMSATEVSGSPQDVFSGMEKRQYAMMRGARDGSGSYIEWSQDSLSSDSVGPSVDISIYTSAMQRVVRDTLRFYTFTDADAAESRVSFEKGCGDVRAGAPCLKGILRVSAVRDCQEAHPQCCALYWVTDTHPANLHSGAVKARHVFWLGGRAVNNFFTNFSTQTSPLCGAAGGTRAASEEVAWPRLAVDLDGAWVWVNATHTAYSLREVRGTAAPVAAAAFDIPEQSVHADALKNGSHKGETVPDTPKSSVRYPIPLSVPIAVCAALVVMLVVLLIVITVLDRQHAKRLQAEKNQRSSGCNGSDEYPESTPQDGAPQPQKKSSSLSRKTSRARSNQSSGPSAPKEQPETKQYAPEAQKTQSMEHHSQDMGSGYHAVAGYDQYSQAQYMQNYVDKRYLYQNALQQQSMPNHFSPRSSGPMWYPNGTEEEMTALGHGGNGYTVPDEQTAFGMPRTRSARQFGQRTSEGAELLPRKNSMVSWKLDDLVA